MSASLRPNRAPEGTREVGRRLHLSERTIQRQCEAEQIRAVQIGRQWRIPVAELRRLLGGEGMTAIPGDKNITVCAEDIGALLQAIKDAASEPLVIELRPGDVIVIECPHSLSDVAFERISAVVHDLFPLSRVAILEEGMRMRIVRPCGDDPTPASCC